MKALSNEQVFQPGWYYFEPESSHIGSRPRFLKVEDDSEITDINRGIPRSNRGTWYGPLSIQQLKDPESPPLTPYTPPTVAQRTVMIYHDNKTGEYSCYPALGELPRMPCTATVDGPTWIAKALNDLRQLLTSPLK